MENLLLKTDALIRLNRIKLYIETNNISKAQEEYLVLEELLRMNKEVVQPLFSEATECIFAHIMDNYRKNSYRF